MLLLVPITNYPLSITNRNELLVRPPVPHAVDQRGRGEHRAFSRLTCSSLNTGPACTTNVSPSSLVKNSLSPTATGDAEKPSRIGVAEPILIHELPARGFVDRQDALHVVDQVEIRSP